MPPFATPARPRNSNNSNSPYISPARSDFFDLLVYALPRFSDSLRRLTDIKNSAVSHRLKMSPAAALWLTLALIGLVISANSYFMGFQGLLPDAKGHLVTVIPLGREDVLFKPMVLFPPLLLWLSKAVNFSMWLVGLVIPDLPLSGGTSPQWHPAPRLTVWSNATLALAWWFGFLGSTIISATQGLFTRTVPLNQQRAYAERLNKINAIALNPKGIARARHEVSKANNWGRSAMWGMCLLAVAGWGWELFLANGALDGSNFDIKARWIYGLASTFMAELCWFIAEHSGKRLD